MTLRNDCSYRVIEVREKDCQHFDFLAHEPMVARKTGRQIKKKHSRTSPDVQFKEFSLTKQTTRPRTNYE